MSDPRLRVIRGGEPRDVEAVLAALDEPTIEVRFPRDPAWRHQILTISLVDLLARLFPRLRINGPPGARADPLLPPGDALLVDRLEAVRRNGITPRRFRTTNITVAVGDSGPADFYVDGAGWLAYVGTAPSRLAGSEAHIPIGPLAAAARAGAQVFGRLLGGFLSPPPPSAIATAYASALTYRTSSDPFSEPTPDLLPSIGAVLVGAGSVGGATAAGLRFVPDLSGELDVVDPQILEDGDFVRASLATREACAARAAKTQVVKDALQHHRGLAVRAYWMRMSEFVAGRERDARLPLVLSPVDSVASRREIQDALPLELINAACDSTHVSISGHVTDDGPCVYCLHLPDVLDAEQIRERVVASRMNLPPAAVRQALVSEAPLSPEDIRRIEQANSLTAGTLQHQIGRTLSELYAAEFLYAEVTATSGPTARIAVASPFVTALAGYLLAGELLKASGGRPFAAYRLGARGKIGTKYAESIFHGPLLALTSDVQRWPGSECLCRSTRRLRILRRRYGLAPAA